MKSTWKILNEITNRNRRRIEYTKEFLSGEKLINDGKEIANCFNNFFTNIGPSLAKKNKCPKNISYTHYLGDNLKKSMYLNPASEEEIINIVSKFSNKQSCGHDGISMSTVKSIIHSISDPFTCICNKSFQTGIFPDEMKIAKIVPLFKTGNRKEFSNYRPVSILPQFSKILEKLFYNRLVSFVKINEVLYKSQYGFREKHSTGLALMELMEEITSNLDNGFMTTGVFIDLKKAFDTIDHPILIQKLNHYGVRGIALNWIENYLSNRQQYVIYNKMHSDKKRILCGVPQGSIIGPLLFLLYINDLANVSKKLKFILFADDTNVFYTGKNIKDVSNTLNEELKHMNSWFKVNKLSLNVSKTNYMLFSGKRNYDDFNISIDGMRVDRVHVTKFLGVLVDENLSWTDHIISVCKNVSKNVSILYKVKHILNSSSLYTLYCSLVLPYLNYACEIWGNTYQSRVNNVFLLQKRAIRNVAKVHYRDHTNPLFVKFRCLKFNELVNIKTLIIVFQAKKNTLPVNIQKLFTKSENTHDHNTRFRNKGNFDVKFCKTKLKSMLISIKGVKLWNELDKSLHELRSIHCFKNKLKNSYIHLYSECQ